MNGYELVVVASLAWCGALLTLDVIEALALGLRRTHAPSRGSPWRGLVFALGPGMMPWHKEGARRHPEVYAAGVVYHASIAGAFGVLAWRLAAGPVPRAWAVLVAVPLIAGAAAGGWLFARRWRSTCLREISTPDDFASNAVVDLFVIAAAATAVRADLAPVLLVSASALFLYAPLGKIRHCVFFPLARAFHGLSFGRRAVLPGTAARRR